MHLRFGDSRVMNTILSYYYVLSFLLQYVRINIIFINPINYCYLGLLLQMLFHIFRKQNSQSCFKNNTEVDITRLLVVLAGFISNKSIISKLKDMCYFWNSLITTNVHIVQKFHKESIFYFEDPYFPSGERKIYRFQNQGWVQVIG